jgi:hypothetical protein
MCDHLSTTPPIDNSQVVELDTALGGPGRRKFSHDGGVDTELILVFCVSRRYACVFGAFYRYLTSTISDIYHSLVRLLLGEHMSYVVRPTKQNNKQPKKFFFLSRDCSMSTLLILF